MGRLTAQEPVRLVQITDSHLRATAEGTLLKMNTRESLGHVLRTIEENESRIDLIVATGDISQDASRQAYEEFLKSIATFNVPYRWIVGNHDNAELMAQAAKDTDACGKTVSVNNWLVLMLNSSVNNQVHGRLNHEELAFLEKNLEQAELGDDIAHCLVCIHHNPVPGSSGWMEGLGLENSKEFFNILSRFSVVRSVVYGHIHQELDFMHNGIRCFCTPSTCIQFKPSIENFALDRMNPGYRTFQLYSDGHIESEVIRVTDIEFEVDYSGAGY
jgi:Icc protein